jgi:hypothetical protein
MSPTFGANNANETNNSATVCTELAQKPARSPRKPVTFPVTIEFKDKRAKIYKPAKGFSFYRNQKAAGGILLTLEKPSKPVREETTDAGRYTSALWHKKDSSKIQILTIECLLDGMEKVDFPPQDNPFAKAQREAKPEKQTDLI